MAITTFEFVSLDPQSNLKPGKNSSQIRSRCMQGKNKRDGSRRSRKEGKKLLQDSSTEGQTRRQNVPLQASSKVKLSSQAFISLDHPQSSSMDVQLSSGNLVVEAFAYDITNRSLSPFDCCVDFESIPGHMVPFEKLHFDKLFVNSIMATGYALNDFKVLGKSASPTQQTMQHLQNTLSLLQVKLQSPVEYQDAGGRVPRMGSCCRTSPWAAKDRATERRLSISCKMAETAVQTRPVRGCRQSYIALQVLTLRPGLTSCGVSLRAKTLSSWKPQSHGNP
jgi:hypothetical protein